MLRWRLAEIMARYKITNKALVEILNMSLTAISNLKNSDCLPELNSNKLCNISRALSSLTGIKITPFDLMEYIEN
jgi:DNA-binding Xre family transcriptional regulator